MSTRITRTELGANDDGRRLDRIVRKYLPEIPLSRIYRALRSREITVNGKRVRGDTRVAEGDSLEIADSLRGARRAPAEAGDTASEIAGRIVHETGELLVVNKAWGELTHGEDSLETKVLRYLTGRGASGISFRPGPVHRLDRNTSGLVVFGASLAGAQKATEDLQAGRIVKRYVAILEGVVASDRWEDALERDTERRVTRTTGDKHETEREVRGKSRAKKAVTRVEPVATAGNCSLVIAQIDTGRTHQIRAQAAHHGHPLLGDRKYGSAARGPYSLHAATLSADDPDARVDFDHLVAPLPDRFRARVAELFGDAVVERLEHILLNPPD
ncbi:MAG TPA: RluA family pseudouridine synthase [Spirochaetia bacterium]|nr:RluA family pseudouridine synthase [Spirochaetia bacterium]